MAERRSTDGFAGSEAGVERLYLDDTREAPAGWLRVRTVGEAILVLARGHTLDLSLDHDLRSDPNDPRPGIALCEWLVETGRWPARSVRIHSSNRSGSVSMIEAIRRAGRYPHYHPALRLFTSDAIGALYDQGWTIGGGPGMRG